MRVAAATCVVLVCAGGAAAVATTSPSKSGAPKGDDDLPGWSLAVIIGLPLLLGGGCLAALFLLLRPPADPPPDPVYAQSPTEPACPVFSWFGHALGFEEEGWATARDQLRARARRDPSDGTLLINGRRVGEWRLPNVAELREEALRAIRLRGRADGAVRVSNIAGDVKQAHADPRYNGALFQAASQFNCLEMISPGVTPEAGVTCYSNDHTQGPACATSCAAATAFRNYLVRWGDSKEEGQSAERQIDTLSDLAAAIGTWRDEPLWTVRNGYSDSSGEKLREISRRIVTGDRAKLRSLIRFGLHFDAEVTAAAAPPGQLVGQAYCSAHAIGYSHGTAQHDWEQFARLTLEAQYEGTLWAAVLYAEWRRRHGRGSDAPPCVVLTKLGGGVFANRIQWIADAIEHAVTEMRAAGADLDVRILHFGHVDRNFLYLEEPPPQASAAAAGAAGGGGGGVGGMERNSAANM